MKLLVLGTSNSILKGGYVDALRIHPNITTINRVGPGGSTSIMLPFFGEEIDFSEFDFVIVDTSINDGAFLDWGLLMESEAMDNLRWLLRTATTAGCMPVILCMPNRARMNGGDTALALYKKAASEYRAPLFDGYKFAETCAREIQRPVNELFQDDLHLLPSIAALMAPAIVDLCRETKCFPTPSVAFRRIEAGDLNLPLRDRQTSLLSAQCAILSAEDCVCLALKLGERLAGVVYNAGRTSGSLIFKGQEKTAVNVRSHYFQKNDLVVAARQVSPSVRPHDGYVRLFLQHSDEVREAEIVGLIVRCQ